MNVAVERAAAVMAGFSGVWGIAGGWAIDLFLNRESRLHPDIDLAVLRCDQRALRSWVTAGRVEKVISGRVTQWARDEPLEEPVHEVHVTWSDGFQIEFLLNEYDQQTREWVFRRDPGVRRSLAATFVSERNVPYLAPEIVLLYKSKAPSAKDDADLGSVLPHLQAEQRSWLYQALQVTAPGHRWADIIFREP